VIATEAEVQVAVNTEVNKKDSERVTPLFATVDGYDENREPWKESADVTHYTASGAGLFLACPCEVGSLVQLTVPLPPHLRCYDHDQEMYQVWGLVQNCQMSTSEDTAAYNVGVAFIGKTPPESYEADPTQQYRICGMNEDGLWNVTEAKGRFVARRELRYWKKIEMYLALIDSRRETIGGERAITENISRNGAAVITTLDLVNGDRVKFISEEFDFSGLAVVCNSQQFDGGKRKLNLEFVETPFPIENLKTRTSR